MSGLILPGGSPFAPSSSNAAVSNPFSPAVPLPAPKIIHAPPTESQQALVKINGQQLDNPAASLITAVSGIVPQLQ